MSNLFGNVSNDPRMQRHALASKYNAARSNILLLVIFSAINLIMLATNAGTYFLFSASVPYLITGLGMFFCGMAPEEAYEGLDGMYFMDKSLFVVMFIISMLILVLYLLCWLFSKNNKVKWLITALVLFSIDTLIMFAYYGISPNMIIDIIFHIWVIVILAMGIDAHYKLKKMPVEETMIEAEYTEISEEEFAGEAAAAIEEKSAEEETPIADEQPDNSEEIK
jgi:fatty acid desaturase